MTYYGIEEHARTKALHLSRRMFAIVDGNLLIANENASYSHAEWFEKGGLISSDGDSSMSDIVRGAVYPGEVYFYVGWDFAINDDAERIFFHFLDELAEKLNLRADTRIYGGHIKGEPGTKWAPRKSYGVVADRVKR